MNNTKDQNPCLVAAYLQGVCFSGEYTIYPLPVDSHYIGPDASEANSCECSTVTYSLVSACGDCQNGTSETWSSWSYNCSTVYNGSFPMDIPTDTAVPNWAYLNVITSDQFDVVAAQLDGESTATNVQSTVSVILSTSGASASLTSIVTGSSSASPSPTSTSESSDAGAIAGGVVGGVAALAVIIGLAAWFLVRRRRSTRVPSVAFNDIAGGPGYAQGAVYPFESQMVQQPRLYDPSDPSTFPPSSTIQAISSAYENPSIPSQIYSNHGQYTGAPEL